jgi:hypothetical protein
MEWALLRPGRVDQAKEESAATSQFKPNHASTTVEENHHFMTFSFKPSMAMWHQVDLTIVTF